MKIKSFIVIITNFFIISSFLSCVSLAFADTPDITACQNYIAMAEADFEALLTNAKTAASINNTLSPCLKNNICSGLAISQCSEILADRNFLSDYVANAPPPQTSAPAPGPAPAATNQNTSNNSNGSNSAPSSSNSNNITNNAAAPSPNSMQANHGNQLKNEGNNNPTKNSTNAIRWY